MLVSLTNLTIAWSSAVPALFLNFATRPPESDTAIVCDGRAQTTALTNNATLIEFFMIPPDCAFGAPRALTHVADSVVAQCPSAILESSETVEGWEDS